MEPSQIPVEGLTHLNFAFAYIVPGSYDIVVMPGVGTNLLQQVTDQKKANPDLKVYVSIGGWSFNDNK
jgi:chitinase